MPEFFVGEETLLDAREGAEILVEISEGLAGAHGFEETILDEAEEGFEIGFAVGLVLDADGAGELAPGFGGDGFGMMFGEKFAEITAAGGEVEAAFVARFGEDLCGLIVRMFFAEVKDEGLVFLWEGGECVEASHKF